MKAGIKVSVVIAAYNAERYLRQAIVCVTHQTLEDIERILVDDDSTDSTYAIMQEYATRDSRIQVLRHTEKTFGGGAARNLGIEAAQGKYISVLDADDFFLPTMLERAYAKAEATEAELVMFDGDLFDDVKQQRQHCHWLLRKQYLPQEASFAPADYADTIFEMPLGSAWNLFLRRSLIQENGIKFESLHNSNDTTFALLALALAKRIAVLPEKLLLYRRNNVKSIYGNFNKYPADLCEALLRLRHLLEQHGVWETFRAGFACHAVRALLADGDALWRAREDKAAFLELYQALQERYAEQLCFYEPSDEQLQLVSGKPYLPGRRAALRDMDAEEYYTLFFASDAVMALPQGTKVVIYGAGDQGKLLVEKANKHKWELLGWADRNWQELGSPIIAPESVAPLEADYVLIAIENRNICQQVKSDLVSLGVPAEKICYAVKNQEQTGTVAVTVIMPVLNGMPYFPRALESVRVQSLSNIEIIVVDAGSTDGTREYVEKCQAADWRLKLIASDQRSYGRQCNLGIEKARGRYIAFCESDDYLGKDMLSALCEAAEKNDSPDVVKSDFEMFIDRPEGELSLLFKCLPRAHRGKYGQVTDLEHASMIFDQSNIWNGIYRTDFLRGQGIRENETRGAAFQDIGFSDQVYFLAQSVLFIEQEGAGCYHYRRDNENASSYDPGRVRFRVQEIEFLLDFLEARPKLKEKFSRRFFSREFHLFAGDYGKAISLGREVVEEDVERLRQHIQAFLARGNFAWREKIMGIPHLAMFLSEPGKFRQLSVCRATTALDRQRAFARSVRSQQRGLIVFGAGELGSCVVTLIRRNGYEGELCLCDNASDVVAQRKKLGISIYTPDGALRRMTEASFILTIPEFFGEMRQQLQWAGVPDERIIYAPPVWPHMAFETDWQEILGEDARKEKH